jgi:hypothetical protein
MHSAANIDPNANRLCDKGECGISARSMAIAPLVQLKVLFDDGMPAAASLRRISPEASPG